MRSRVALIAVIAALCVSGCATTRTTSARSVTVSSQPALSEAASSAPESSPGPASVDPVPSPFAAACGHPGTVVTVVALPVTVHKKTCDLTGVIVRYGPAGVIVPAVGGVGAQYDASTGATSLSADVDAKTGDVTIH